MLARFLIAVALFATSMAASAQQPPIEGKDFHEIMASAKSAGAEVRVPCRIFWATVLGKASTSR